MKINKLTIAGMFIAGMAWSGVAQAGDPCGVPVEFLDSCEVVAEPECYEVCEPDAMLVSCMSDGSAACIAQCADAQAIDCQAGCTGECKASCADGVIPQEPQNCEVSCGSSCMGECAATCLASDDKTLCFAACGQQCSAHCTISCEGGGGGYEPGGGGATCEASCEQACSGSCSAEGARDCEIGCQAKASSSCKAGLTERCHEVCRDGGVLMCDEQFIDIDDVEACMTELGESRVVVAGSDTVLRPGHAKVASSGASCSVEDQAKLGLAGALFTLLSFGFGASVLRRRRS